MSPDIITRIGQYGGQAGQELCNRYSYGRTPKGQIPGFDTHRQWRARVLLPKLTETLAGLAEGLDTLPVGVEAPKSARQLLTLKPHCIEIIEKFSQNKVGKCPRAITADASIRLVANANRIPKNRIPTTDDVRPTLSEQTPVRVKSVKPDLV